ncbi:FUSC family protein, partial [Vibrio parahaemolyticus]
MTLDPALRLGLQAALAVAAALGLAEFGFTERPLWVAVTAMLIICGSCGENLVRGTERALGTLAGVIAAHFV